MSHVLDMKLLFERHLTQLNPDDAVAVAAGVNAIFVVGRGWKMSWKEWCFFWFSAASPAKDHVESNIHPSKRFA